ncbi:MAG TPA: hypothetical protein VG366_05400 [Solirubrobacteraceae bacterium]|nr:hypothetical protein [Solirubrobacteraceae bacterium]
MSERPSDETELLELIRAIDVPAPERLHARTAALDAPRRAGGRERFFSPRRRLGAAGGLVAAVAIVLALVLSSGGGVASFSLRSASALALAPATGAAPAESSSRRTQLAAAVQGVAFPYWGERFGWRSTGSRSDRLAGRRVTTVFYSDPAGRRIGYAIVAGVPSPGIAGGTVRWRAGVPYRLSRIGGDRVVAWVRSGHLCIVAGPVSTATLLMLASWHERGTPA